MPDRVAEYKAQAISNVAMAHNPVLNKLEAENALEVLHEFYTVSRALNSEHGPRIVKAMSWINRLVAVLELPDTMEELQFAKWIEDLEKEERRAEVEKTL